ncbi:flagellar motor switch protein FliN [Scatolibacter rhodanostii]|uniref:flagellar motor switch protein FliN n=1 Tax=Scatolibacter rhodanostii TaxID=2014781 RepID=UPI0013563BF6|nr:flagellar motor switch protein FliN [Scatolibacter rhodanostii]
MTDHTHRLLTAEELDTIGEIMNISMGSAATAVSTLLENQVTITTPQLQQSKFKDIDNSGLNPALIIKISYVQGIEGTNIMMFRRRDIQIILDLLMGNEISEGEDDFEFDDMSMSAASEVMNQMMGASATALSEILDRPINISTPEALLVEEKNENDSVFFEIEQDQCVVAISFKMMIKGILDTTFTCFLSNAFATEIIKHVSEPIEEDIPQVTETAPVVQQAAAPVPPTAPVTEQPVQQPSPLPVNEPAFVSQPPVQEPVVSQPAKTESVPQQPMPAYVPPQQAQPIPPTYVQPPQQAEQPEVARPPMQFGMVPPQMPVQQLVYAGQQGIPYQAATGGYPPSYPYAPQQQQPMGYRQPEPANIQNAEFPDFSKQNFYASAPSGSNMGLLMGVQLEVSVVIGRTKRKIKDVMEFGQGTVVELDKQTGAPAEIMVNGQLLAYGDVIVVGDNFGIRITEIVGTKELLNSLDSNM